VIDCRRQYGDVLKDRMSVSRPLVSTVTLAWNRKEDLRESLLRIQNCAYPNLEIIVCDNGSNDGTAAMVRSEFPNVILLEMGNNIGIEAYNVGFKQARGKYIVILDDDSFPDADAIGRMVEYFEADARLGIVAFDVRSYSSYDQVVQETKQENAAISQKYLMGFNGAGAGVRRLVFEEAGYYPGEFFLYWNEQDLALRALDDGWKIQFFSDIVAYHKYSPANRTSQRAPYYYCRNAFWLIWKNYPILLAMMQTLKLGRLVVHHSIEQKTLIYLRAMMDAMTSWGKIVFLRRAVKPSIARAFRAPVELSFTFYK
jgi:GT2 family glycosyltransferase